MANTDDQPPETVATPPPHRERVDPESGEIVEALPDETTEEECGC